MRSLRLIEVAAQAESLRLRCQAAGMVRMAVFAAIAALFGLFALALLHIAALLWLAPEHGEMRAVLYITAADALVAVIFVIAARRNKYRRVAEEALHLRQDSIRMLRQVSPIQEAANVMPWRGLAVGLGSRVALGLGRRLLLALFALLVGRRRRRR